MRKLTYALLILTIMACFSCGSPKKEDNKATIANETNLLNAFLNHSFDRRLDRDPMFAEVIGVKTHPDKWNDLSDSFAQVNNNAIKADLDSLKTYDTSKLDANAKLSYALFEMNCKDALESFQYRYNNFPVNQQDGMHTDAPTFLQNICMIKNLGDAKNYITRVKGFKKLFYQVITNIKIREAKGIIAPKFVYPEVLAACKNVITGAPFDNGKEKSPLYKDFLSKIDTLKTIKAATRDSLHTVIEESLNNSVKPAYDTLMAVLTAQEQKATDRVGAWTFPDGDKYYQLNLRLNTTTNMKAEEIYQFGLQEVARIQGEIKVLMARLQFKGSVQDFFVYMTDPKNPHSFYPNDEEGRKKYLALATDYINNMKKKLDGLFKTKPKADIIVKAVEKFREPSAETAFYEQPAPDGSRPGRFYVNLRDMSQSPVFQLEALAYHEGIPGHHMQISIAQELQNMPQFRKFDGNNAYVEGWALYCESIPKEIGFYQDIYQDFGRLSMELMRAARCVVDPGIHYKHWSKDSAISYFRHNTAEPPKECEHAIERYIIWPGQATGYKIGMHKIQELRAKAQKELGSKFDIREFHDVILVNGALPLSILETEVNNYIARKK